MSTFPSLEIGKIYKCVHETFGELKVRITEELYDELAFEAILIDGTVRYIDPPQTVYPGATIKLPIEYCGFTILPDQPHPDDNLEDTSEFNMDDVLSPKKPDAEGIEFVDVNKPDDFPAYIGYDPASGSDKTRVILDYHGQKLAGTIISHDLNDRGVEGGEVCMIQLDTHLPESDTPPSSWPDRVAQWAYARNLIGGSDPKSQMKKLDEETDELALAIGDGDLNEIKDAIGDCCVVLRIIAEQCDLKWEDCLEHAWEQIKNRTGKLVDGVFQKDE